jgi:hypothetical protein
MSEERISEEEFRERLELAQKIINHNLAIQLSVNTRELREALNALNDDEFRVIIKRLFAISEELEDLRLTYVFKVLSAVIGDAYISIDGKTIEEMQEIYKTAGFNPFLDDNDGAFYLGVVKLVDGYALLSTLSQPFDPFELMYAVKHTKP